LTYKPSIWLDEDEKNSFWSPIVTTRDPLPNQNLILEVNLAKAMQKLPIINTVNSQDEILLCLP
jgi:hypothetical protein